MGSWAGFRGRSRDAENSEREPSIKFDPAIRLHQRHRLGRAGACDAAVNCAKTKFMKNLKRIIAEHPFLCGLAPEQLDILTEGAREVTFRPNEVIFREGEPANRFYLISSGRIALEAHEPADGTALVQYLSGGDVLGWSWLLPPFVWHFGARAAEPTRAIVLNGAHILAAAERNREFGYELMKRMAQVVIQRLQATRRRLLQQQIESELTA